MALSKEKNTEFKSQDLFPFTSSRSLKKGFQTHQPVFIYSLLFLFFATELFAASEKTECGKSMIVVRRTEKPEARRRRTDEISSTRQAASLETISSEILRLASESQRRIAVRVVDEKGNVLFDGGGSTSFRAASTIKLFILKAIIERAKRDPSFLSKKVVFRPAEHLETRGTGILKDRREENPDLTISDYIDLMLKHSDNIATNILISELGMEAINESIQQSQYSGTALRRRMVGYVVPAEVPENTSTASDLTQVLQWFRENDLAASTLLSSLRASDEPRYIGSGFPGGFEVIVKSGILDNSYHEVGYINYDGRTFSFAVMTQWSASGNAEYSSRLFTEIGKLIVDILMGPKP